MKKDNFKLSIVTPFYNEECGGMINIYFDEVIKELKNITDNWEIICIDDGSQDNTFGMLTEYHKKDNRIKVLKFSRNFGKEAALTAGLDFVSGDIVIPMDADLQHPPSLIKEMLLYWQNGYDVVLPVRKTRRGSFPKEITSKLFYWFIGKISNKEFVVKNAGDFRLMDKKVVNTVRGLKEYHRFMKGILSWPGFKRKDIEYEVPKREFGETKYSYVKMCSLAFDCIFSFSTSPIKFITFFGLSLSFISFIFGMWLIFEKVFFNFAVPGYTSIMVSVLFLGGMNMMAIGVVGEYVGRIYDEVKKRPVYVIDEKLY